MIDQSRVFDIGTSRATLNELKTTWLKAKKADTIPENVTFSKSFRRGKWSFYRPDSKAPLLSQVIKLDGVFVPVGSLITVWLSKQNQHGGIRATNELEAKIAQRWLKMQQQIKNGLPPAIALSEFEADMREIFEDELEVAFLAGREAIQDDLEDEQDPMALIAAAIVSSAVLLAMSYLRKFLNELNSELNSQASTQQMIDVLARRKARALMYSGEAWKVYNEAKIIGFPPDSVWKWSGPIDSRSCAVCVQEVAAGARPLSEITRLPGRDTNCVTHCRHELIQVKR